MGKRAFNCRFLAALVVSVPSSLFVPLQQSQAQLFIHVYPNQDNPTNQTLWIFSGSSSAIGSGSIRTGSNNYDVPDSWQIATSDNSGNIFDANKPSDVNFSLSPLFSSSNIKDIHSVSNRIPGGVSTNTIFAASATNTPTLTIGSANRTISHLYLDENSGNPDNMGIRVSGSNFSYSSGNSSAWTGAGILNKPIGDFFAGTFRSATTGARFAANSEGSVRVVVNSQIITEPEEYALASGLFALAFVLFHRRMMPKKQRQ